jgi:hypothetical protein
MNFPFRLENACMRFRDSSAESLARLGRSIFNSLFFSRFLATTHLRMEPSAPRIAPDFSR